MPISLSSGKFPLFASHSLGIVSHSHQGYLPLIVFLSWGTFPHVSPLSSTYKCTAQITEAVINYESKQLRRSFLSSVSCKVFDSFSLIRYISQVISLSSGIYAHAVSLSSGQLPIPLSRYQGYFPMTASFTSGIFPHVSFTLTRNISPCQFPSH